MELGSPVTTSEDEDATRSPPVSPTRLSDMEYSDENKENVDPNPVERKRGGVLAPRESGMGGDGLVENLRRSTEKLNISNPENMVRK